MRSRFFFHAFTIVVSLDVILACSFTSAPIPRSSTAPPATTPPPQSGIPFFASPIKLVIPDGLATSASAETLDVVTDQTGAPWDVAPAHLQITLQGYTLESSFHVPQIFVYPAQNYAAANPRAAESIKRLQAILSNPGNSYSNDVLPYVPFFNAGQVIAAQEKVVQFQGGSGLRIVTQYAQDISPINNGGLFYHFEGLTSDGKYYLLAILPTNLPFLPADNNPASVVPSGGLPFPQSNATGASFDSYYKQISDMINSTSAGQFNPSVDILDALIQSISYQ